MKTLKRNQTTVYYANYVSSQEAVDSDGNYTGETTSTYSSPKELKVYVSVPNGSISREYFTPINDYDRLLITDDTKLNVDERTVFWIEQDTSKPYNYIVKNIAKSLNVLSIGVKEVRSNG